MLLSYGNRLLPPRDQVTYSQKPVITSFQLAPNLFAVALQTQAAMIEGGPCNECGATQASIWYGKRGEPKYCKKGDCMRAGGYLPPLKAKGATAKRARPGLAAAEVKVEPESVSIDATVEEIIDIYGQRCACPLPMPSARAPDPQRFPH